MKALVFISIAILMIFGSVWFMYNNAERSPQNTKTPVPQETIDKSPQGGRAVWGPQTHVFETDIADPLQAPQEKDGAIMPQPTHRPRDFSSGSIVPGTSSRVQGLEDWRPLLLASGLLAPGELTHLQDYDQIEAYVKKFLDYQVLKGAISAEEAAQAKQILTVRYDQLRKGTYFRENGFTVLPAP
jgi:hypothetical protein